MLNIIFRTILFFLLANVGLLAYPQKIISDKSTLSFVKIELVPVNIKKIEGVSDIHYVNVQTLNKAKEVILSGMSNCSFAKIEPLSIDKYSDKAISNIKSSELKEKSQNLTVEMKSDNTKTTETNKISAKKYKTPVETKRDTVTSALNDKPGKTINTIKPKIQPPAIKWLYPADSNLTSYTGQCTIRAGLRSTSSINSAKIIVNGVVHSLDKMLKEGNSDSYQWIMEYPLALKSGANSISIVASNIAGNTSSEKRFITYEVKRESKNPVSNVNTNTEIAAYTETPKTIAPVISWISPSLPNTDVNQYTAKIKAKIKSGEKLQSVLVYINDVASEERAFTPSPEAIGEYLLEKPITLQSGENSIYIVATNETGATKSELRYLTNPTDNPPLINWNVPDAPVSSVMSESVNIEVCIKSITDLKSAQIYVNGTQQINDMVFQRSGINDCNYVWQKPIILKEGDNGIFIIATNMAGSTTSEKRVIKMGSTMSEKRLALVIGNSVYGETNLKNPVNDANLIEGTLKDLGFEVIKRVNASKTDMENAIKIFSKKLPDYNVTLFYYAGHGIQVEGMNYLIPVDAVMKEKTDCKWEAIAVNYVVEEFEKYPDNTNIVILDACRNNPFISWERGGETGFKAISPASGTIISFATSEGAAASDGQGANGLFTEELVKQMIIPQPIESVFKKTRVQVEKRSKNAQSPQEWSKLKGDFYFKK